MCYDIIQQFNFTKKLNITSPCSQGFLQEAVEEGLIKYIDDGFENVCVLFQINC